MATAKRTLWIEAKLADLLSRPLTDMERKLVRFGQVGGRAFGGITSSVFSMNTAIAAGVAGLAAFAGFQGIKGIAEQTAQLGRLADAMGDDVRNLSELGAAFERVGGKGEQFNDTLRGLQNQARAAQLGNVDLLRAFQDLGVELEDLQQLSPSQLLERMAAGLERFTSAQEKELRLGRILPEQYLRLLPLVGRGLEQFQQQVIAARRAGATVDPEDVRAAQAFQQSLADLGTSFESVVRELVTRFGPSVAAVLQRLARLIAENKDAIADAGLAIGRGIVTGVDLAVRGIIELIDVIESIPGVNLLSDEDTDRQIRNLEELARTTRQFHKKAGTFGSEEFQRAIDPINAQLRQLIEKRDAGLANALREGRKNLLAELQGAAAAFRGEAPAPAPLPPELVAGVVGMPTPEQVAELNAQVEAEAARGRARLSVLRDTPGQAAPPAQDARDRLLQQANELQRVAQLAPTLRPLQTRLAEIKRAAAVLELQSASRGVLAADELEAAIARVNEEFARGERLVTGGDFFGGFERGARESIKALTDLEQAGEEAGRVIVEGGFNGVTEALVAQVQRVDGWRQAWKRASDAIVADLTRIAARLAATAALSALGLGVGFADGGVIPGGTGSHVPFRAFAQGGVVTGPTVALMGEGKHDEAVVPMPRGAIPVELRGGGRGVTIVNQWHVHTLDGKAASRVLYENQGTLAAIQRDQLMHQVGTRQILQRATS